MAKITIETLKMALDEMDLKFRPFALFINPEDYKILMEKKDEFMPGVLDDYKIYQTDLMERGKVALIKRNEMEQWFNGRD